MPMFLSSSRNLRCQHNILLLTAVLHVRLINGLAVGQAVNQGQVLEGIRLVIQGE